MKRTRRLAVGTTLGAVLGAVGLVGGCVDSSSNPAPTSDASVPVLDAGAADTTPPSDASPQGDGQAPPDAGKTDAGPTDAGPGALTTIGTLVLKAARQSHTATLLGNGHVLVCGGYGGTNASLATCDDVDPTTNTVAAAPPMSTGRQSHVAVTLPNGKVLVAGGFGMNAVGKFDALSSAEIYDPVARTFSAVARPMTTGRAGHGAVLLTTGANAGKVALVGGYGDGSFDSGVANDFSLDSAEVFDPGADPTQGTFFALGAHMSARRGGTLTTAPLPGGGLLAAGGATGPFGGPYGYLATADTLDPALGAFTPTTGPMASARQGAMSVALASGAVLVVDGAGPSGSAPAADLFDPASRTFSSVPQPAALDYMAIALLKSGRVMLAGGGGAAGPVGDAIVLDVAAKTFVKAAGTLTPPRSLATATALPDGRVFIMGGQAKNGSISPAIDVFTE